MLHLQFKDIYISATLKRSSVHRTSSPTGNTKNIWSADPRRNASLSSHTQRVKEFLSGEIILAKMGLFAELEFKFFLCVYVLKNMVFKYCVVVSKNGFC